MQGGKIITATLSHSNYLKAIRSSAQLIKVSISQLLKHRREYFGKRVEVRGYYRSYIEYSGLYERKEDVDRIVENPAMPGAINDGLWIMPFGKPGFEANLHFGKEGWVRVIGVFSYNTQQQDLGVGHLNGWPAELTSLELFEPVH